ncbi:uncharacterized protein GLRG_09155 [Colletotrichum graminicola M1.001]|uniref:CPAF-like PDZ domain-containing protein n=1 Tax=Colletotrichum graminicola (strain M1.001 / M2 / FGSC 10212) TaxID=645133 RepID=E3QT23_COLGM|nr:uncharacterized protein GLRG_09155 [Colletotrichum graminicola M1.001]EFQ34011.1 hypothetical protein GLRG_09155 [Colletotrichum graminicola M1.001]
MRSSSVVSPALLVAATALIPFANGAEPCAQVSAAWAAQHESDPTVTPLVPAKLAHACLNSVPIDKDAAIALIDSLVPYMEWQTDPTYKADPPAGYDFPGYDMFAALSKIRENVQNHVYPGEYAFQSALYEEVFAPGHDGHFVYYPDLLTAVFEWTRERALVSISEDGSSLPVIKIYEEVISTPETASVVTLINGVDASKYLADTVNKASWNRDANSAYNSMFFEMSSPATGAGNGYFSSDGRIRFIYQGANTTITFANGTEATFENHARVNRDLTGVVDGPSFYAKFCNPASPASNTAPGATPTNTTSVLPGYPSSIASTSDGIVSGYFLEGEGFEDVAVIVLTAFESNSTVEFQKVTEQVIASSLAAGKTKLVIDFQQNGGGYVLHGYDFFRTLFPHTVQDGNSRWKENDASLAAAEIISDVVADVNTLTNPDPELISFAEIWFNWRYDYNLTNQPFTSYEDKFAPQVFKDTNYTELMRWNLNDPLTTTNSTFGMGIGMHGYGNLVGLPQPFLPENIVILYDGVCASTCTIASEFLRHQGGVKSIAFGGLPVEGPIEAIGGVKGSEVLDWSDIYAYTSSLLPYASTDEQKAAFDRYIDLPLNRSITAAVNVRDQILRDNIADGIPAQYVREEADCRLYWTLPMISDVTAVWKAAANAAFNGGKCASGGIEKRDVSEKAEKLRKDYLKTYRLQQRFEPVPRDTPATENRFWRSKHVLKAIK